LLCRRGGEVESRKAAKLEILTGIGTSNADKIYRLAGVAKHFEADFKLLPPPQPPPPEHSHIQQSPTMDETQDFKSLQDQIQSALIATTRSTGQIVGEDLGFHRSFNPAVGTALNEQSERMLALARELLKSAASISELRAPVIEDVDDVDNNWRNIVDVVDSLLEKSDTCLDEYTGVIKRRDPTVEQTPQVCSGILC
jgi:methyl-accepting chemotaxis protein